MFPQCMNCLVGWGLQFGDGMAGPHGSCSGAQCVGCPGARRAWSGWGNSHSLRHSLLASVGHLFVSGFLTGQSGCWGSRKGWQDMGCGRGKHPC